MREILPAEAALVVDGVVRFGTFAGPFTRVNPLDARLFGKVPVPRALKALRLKEWQAFQFGNARVFGNVALFNAKTLALAQVKLYDRHTRRKIVFERKLAPWSLTLPASLLDSKARYRSGRCAITFDNALAQGRLTIHLDVPESRDTPKIGGTLTALAADCQPLVVSIPFGDNHGTYSHKGLMPAEGRLTVGAETLVFDRSDSHVFVDQQKGYFPWEMRWDWLTAGGRVEAGRLVGLNLTRNQSIDQDRYNENCVWADGEVGLLPPVEFWRDTTSRPEVWNVRDRAGLVDLRFEVEVEGKVDVHAIILESRYRGPFGTVSGSVRDSRGRQVVIDRLFGMGEDFYLRC